MRDFTDIVYPETVELLEKPKGFITDIRCPDCGERLVVREGYTKFLGCSSYPNCTCKIGIQRPSRPSMKFLADQMW